MRPCEHSSRWPASPRSLTLAAGCQQKTAKPPRHAPQSQPTPRFPDGMLRFDRAPGEKGYWDMPSVSSLVESGVKVEVDAQRQARRTSPTPRRSRRSSPGRSRSIKYRQQNDFADDPMQVCIGPGNPRQMHTPGGMRIIQDRNYKRAYMIFGGGNHTWRAIYWMAASRRIRKK